MTVRTIIGVKCSEGLAKRLFPAEYADLRRWCVLGESTVTPPADIQHILVVMPHEANRGAFAVWMDPDALRKE